MIKNLLFPAEFEVKKLTQDGTFSGYGSVFGVKDFYGEVVEKGAFKKSLREWRKRGKYPKLLWQHDSRQIIGKYMSMKEDDTGLYVEGRLFLDTIPMAKEAYALLKEGELDGMSIGFMVKEDRYDEEKRTRILQEVDLWEVSLVTFPANRDALVTGLKQFDGSTIREYEDYLCEKGHSKREAVLIASKCFNAVMQARDSRPGGGNAPNGGEPREGLQTLMEALRARAL